MARRRVVNEVQRRQADPGVSPNRYVGQVTVDIRVAFPPHANAREVEDLLSDVYLDACGRVHRELEEYGENES